VTKNRIGPFVVPLLIITLGVAWLMIAKGIGGIDWVWTLGLAVVGVLCLLGGIDKITVVVGPFLLIASVLSVLRQKGQLTWDVEVPSLVIAVGVLLLVGRHPMIPVPRWAVEADKAKPEVERSPGASRVKAER
jgi:hypothetical protein